MMNCFGDKDTEILLLQRSEKKLMQRIKQLDGELAALREELAAEKTGAAGVYQQLEICQKQRDNTRQRLAAAEQRNETLAKAAREFMEYAESGWDHFPDVGVNLRAALGEENAKN